MTESNRVRVFVRARPLLCHGDERDCGSQRTAVEIQGSNSQVQIIDQRGSRCKSFVFDRAFPVTSTNLDVFEAAGKPLVEAAINGFNGTLFAYGQTGAGKTHTLMSDDGLTVNLVNDLFQTISQDRDNEYKVTCSYIQIYQEHIYDLLNSTSQHSLSIREDPATGIYIENLSEYVCHLPEDVFELLSIGQEVLVVAETSMNRQSSRSHSVCQIIVERSASSTKDKTKSKTSNASELTRQPHEQAALSTAATTTTPGHVTSGDFYRAGSPLTTQSPTVSSADSVTSQEDGDQPATPTPRSLLKRRSSIPVRRSSMRRRSGLGNSLDSNLEGANNSTDKAESGNVEWNCSSLSDEGITVTPRRTPDAQDVLLKGRINICDLAGSERIKKTQAEGDRLQEAKKINLSLLELGNVIAALAEGKRTHVPYRNSLLTRLLQDSLGGNCKTSFVLCISPAMKDVGETRSTLEFGQRALRVSTAPKVNIQIDYKRLATELQARLNEQDREHCSVRDQLLCANATLQTALQGETERRLREMNDLTLALTKARHDAKQTEQTMQTRNKEKLRSLLLAQLMSLQLVYNIGDLSAMSPQPRRDLSVITGHSTNHHRDAHDASTNHRSSTPPSGYESESMRSIAVEDESLNQCDFDHDSVQGDTMKHHPMDQQPLDRGLCHSVTLLANLKSSCGARETTAIEELLSTTSSTCDSTDDVQSNPASLVERLESLKREVKQLRKSIEKDAVSAILTGFFKEPADHSRENKRVVYSRLTAHLFGTMNRASYTEELLEQTFNAVLLDHTLASCLLVLGESEAALKREQDTPSSLDMEDQCALADRASYAQPGILHNLLNMDTDVARTSFDMGTQTQHMMEDSAVDLTTFPDEVLNNNSQSKGRRKAGKKRLLSRLMCFPARRASFARRGIASSPQPAPRL